MTILELIRFLQRLLQIGTDNLVDKKWTKIEATDDNEIKITWKE